MNLLSVPGAILRLGRLQVEIDCWSDLDAPSLLGRRLTRPGDWRADLFLDRDKYIKLLKYIIIIVFDY